MGDLIRFTYATIAILAMLQHIVAIDYGCPLSSAMTSCSPKCKDDSECFGKKCCANICNTKSCVPDHLKGANTKDGYKNQNQKSGTGSYCGNVKCNSFEKCELDRTTKRERCVRN
ncbi:waprin-Thr1 [Cylas formicarius]|uniref:waprin-Thr1 n=1 Tax=Cylas formicarius TaxID=197179 RepID=UPI002958B632|nr:waprin-Thr1 [Cylas formicarius]